MTRVGQGSVETCQVFSHERLRQHGLKLRSIPEAKRRGQPLHLPPLYRGCFSIRLGHTPPHIVPEAERSGQVTQRSNNAPLFIKEKCVMHIYLIMSRKVFSLRIRLDPKELQHPTFVRIDQQNKCTIPRPFQVPIRRWEGF